VTESGVTHPDASARGRTARDPAMDLVRVLCVVLVVAGHLLMIGATIVPGRGLVVERTLLETPWIGPLTWIAQILPLFFVVGGFAGIGAWRRLEASGGTASDYIRSRILRLARPSIALFAALAPFLPLAAGLPGLAIGPAIGLVFLRPLWRAEASARAA